MEVSPTYGEAWNGRMRCTTGTDQADQEHEVMVENAHQLYETFSQGGAPALIMMRNILEKMLPMDFIVTREAAKFAAEAYIHHMCAVANLIKTCCFEGAAYDLATSLGPGRFTEWKAALVNHAAGKVPNLFRVLEGSTKCQRLPWRGQCGRAAAGCARAAASGWRARCQYYAKFYAASYLTRILAVVICGSGSTCVSVLSP
jgi:hypothetical protein